MNLFRRLAFTSTLATYFLIFVGGLVRVAGAGLGCPDWPKCLGKWIPPTSIAGLPQTVDPEAITLILAWIEFVNRLVGMSVGFLIVATAIVAIVKYRNHGRILWTTIAAMVLVMIEGWQGAVVVSSGLQPIIVTVHLMIGLLIVSLLLYVNQEAYFLGQERAKEKATYHSRARLWTGLLWAIAVIQIILGTQVRSAFEHALRDFPLWSVSERMAGIGFVNDIHMLLGMAIIVFTIVMTYTLIRSSDRPSPLVKQTAVILIILAVAEAGVGLGLYFGGLKPLLQLFHLWIASIFVGVSMVQFVALRKTSDARIEQGRSLMRPIVLSAVIITVMAVGAYGVVRQAELSRMDMSQIKKIPEFVFTERSGSKFGSEQMLGKLNIVEFFFATCKGPCPGMASELSKLYKEFEHSKKVQFVSITVDPERDSLPVLSQYANDLGVDDNRWLFLRSSADTTSRLCEDGFLVSGDLPGMHSTRFILVDQDGWIRGYYAYDDEWSMRKLRRHVIELARKL